MARGWRRGRWIDLAPGVMRLTRNEKAPPEIRLSFGRQRDGLADAGRLSVDGDFETAISACRSGRAKVAEAFLEAPEDAGGSPRWVGGQAEDTGGRELGALSTAHQVHQPRGLYA